MTFYTADKCPVSLRPGEISSVGSWKTSEVLRENGVSLEIHFDCHFWVHCWEQLRSAMAMGYVLAVFLSEFWLVYFQSAGQRSECPWGNSLGPGPTVVVVAEGRFVAVSTVIMVVVDSKTTEYLHVLVLI